MTINIRIRRHSEVVIPESAIRLALEKREAGETINVDIHPKAKVVVTEDETAEDNEEQT